MLCGENINVVHGCKLQKRTKFEQKNLVLGNIEKANSVLESFVSNDPGWRCVA